MAVALRLIAAVALFVGPVTAGGASAAQAPGTPIGELTVIVTDTTGARVADAEVIATRGTERRAATTGNDGLARLPNLGAGSWTLTVTREGFVRWQQAVTIATGVVEVSVDLAIAGLSETIQVEGAGGPPTQVPLNAPAYGGTRLDIAVRDLPASLFLIGQQLIQERGARSAEEAVQLTVGMTASTGVGSIPSYSTRGWGGNNVSLMRDGVRQNSNSQSSRPVDTFILDRIEVLKGPASLLYGEGAIGGAVNMVSKSPISEVRVDTLLSYGSFGSYRIGVGVNVPLRRNLFARVDLSQTGTDGYVEDSPQKLRAAATTVRWLPTSNLSITARGTYTYDDTSSYYSTPFIDGRIDPRTRKLNYNMEDRLTSRTTGGGSSNSTRSSAADGSSTIRSSRRRTISIGTTSKATPTTRRPGWSTSRRTF